MSNFKDGEYKLADGTKSDGFVEEEVKQIGDEVWVFGETSINVVFREEDEVDGMFPFARIKEVPE